MIEAVLFDKDGTLFDFHATWSRWAQETIRKLGEGDPTRIAALADAVRFDLTEERFRRDSPVIAGTHLEAATCLASALPGTDPARLAEDLIESAARAPLVPAADLAAVLDGLCAAGVHLGVMTNDSARVAETHLAAVGIRDRFAFVAGYDSGFGAKPDPGPLLAFAHAVGVAPAAVVMVGDSRHDLVAGRRAGMKTVGVLTGPADADELRDLADLILPSVAELESALEVLGKS